MRWEIACSLLAAWTTFAAVHPLWPENPKKWWLPANTPLEDRDITTTYKDPYTGFTFQELVARFDLTSLGYMTYRIAIPGTPAAGQGYDVILQMVVPVSVGWAGLAWGGGMARSPLTVVWWWQGVPVISTRYSAGHTVPQPYNKTNFTILKGGTRSNSTHWQFTMQCTGCAQFTTDQGKTVLLDPNGNNRLAYAHGPDRPSTMASNTSSITEHNVFGYLNFDFKAAQNAKFADALAKNYLNNEYM